jgi:hypothetical protein
MGESSSGKVVHPNRKDRDNFFDDYNPSILDDFGGGNVSWWQDYIRYEIGRCNDFWRTQVKLWKG